MSLFCRDFQITLSIICLPQVSVAPPMSFIFGFTGKQWMEESEMPKRLKCGSMEVSSTYVIAFYAPELAKALAPLLPSISLWPLTLVEGYY